MLHCVIATESSLWWFKLSSLKIHLIKIKAVTRSMELKIEKISENPSTPKHKREHISFTAILDTVNIWLHTSCVFTCVILTQAPDLSTVLVMWEFFSCVVPSFSLLHFTFTVQKEDSVLSKAQRTQALTVRRTFCSAHLHILF